MCGINAIFAYHPDAPPVALAELIAVRDRMAKRGPDGAGDWMSANNRIGLGHRRLAIIDLSPSGHQPMLAGGPDDPVITYNGEIYNYQALRSELQAAGIRFHTECDTEVILRLYQRDGIDAFTKLRGMFAIAIWDPKRHEMILARDPFGIKPLYLADDGKTIRVASSARALSERPEVDSHISAAGAVGFHLLGSVPDPFTIWQGIIALPAGTSMVVGRNGASSPRKFFDLATEINGPGAGEGDLASALRDSAAAHLVADVPVGLFLSAGLDSTTIAGLVSEISGDPARAITLGFEEFADTPRDEVPLATLAARHYGCDHDIQRVSAREFADNAETITADMDQPTIDGVNVWFVSRAARRAGLKVALSGLGGDEMFCGYDTFTDVPKIRRLARMALGSRKLGVAARHVIGALPLRGRSPKISGLFEYGGTTEGAWLLRRALRMPWELDQVMDPDMAAEGLGMLAIEQRLRATRTGIDNLTDQIQALETGWYMQNQLLRDADWAGMAHGLEIRVPLVDPVLFRHIRRLTASGQRPGKQNMARSARPLLPGEILNRRKTGFFVPVADWVLGDRPAGKSGRGYRGWANRIAGQFGF
ncbi:asparagine synthase (glutamine-hydrolyzing) [Alphaproteobacteria bacterium HT1-32]|nr:asparagine synthase (glutamine-hydrolyzing) [Alphaproteobacteria bacterium HT1-32]